MHLSWVMDDGLRSNSVWEERIQDRWRQLGSEYCSSFSAWCRIRRGDGRRWRPLSSIAVAKATVFVSRQWGEMAAAVIPDVLRHNYKNKYPTVLTDVVCRRRSPGFHLRPTYNGAKNNNTTPTGTFCEWRHSDVKWATTWEEKRWTDRYI